MRGLAVAFSAPAHTSHSNRVSRQHRSKQIKKVSPGGSERESSTRPATVPPRTLFVQRRHFDDGRGTFGLLGEHRGGVARETKYVPRALLSRASSIESSDRPLQPRAHRPLRGKVLEQQSSGVVPQFSAGWIPAVHTD
mmetsp:Transcript_24712/g.76330  ORF Transcript_24712/g.76330 Transcript_24712/m.76330 type:complete len:138 (-) Transcript_24712:179-592(-)